VLGCRLASTHFGGFMQGRYTVLSPQNGTRNQNFDLALGRLAVFGDPGSENVSWFFQFELLDASGPERNRMGGFQLKSRFVRTR
jgi:hypothetical protein